MAHLLLYVLVLPIEPSSTLHPEPCTLRPEPPLQGAAVALRLGELGFRNVTNRNRDFYADVAQRQVPPFDVLVTNPPYRCALEVRPSGFRVPGSGFGVRGSGFWVLGLGLWFWGNGLYF